MPPIAASRCGMTIDDRQRADLESGEVERYLSFLWLVVAEHGGSTLTRWRAKAITASVRACPGARLPS
jgi:hypothetical protein